MVSSQLPPDQVSTITRVYQVLGRTAGNGSGSSSSPCSWKGVICSSDNSSITSLSFNSFSISTSQFLPLLCSLTSLESLDVSQNDLSSVPDDFFAATCGVIRGLKVLNFSRNSLNGPLPPFQGFGMLELMDFSFNNLTGEVNTQLEGLDSLRSLNLSHNKLEGAVPITSTNSSLLEGLQLSANQFSGKIPAEITNFRNLRVIDLSINKISSSIPGDLGVFTRLETLVLSLNNLSGEIPESLSRIRTLSRFAANQNEFTGGIPHGITRYLQTLDLSFNKLTGEIPPDLLSGPKLLSIDVSYNELHGSIPVDISSSLFRLRLRSNFLTGSLPVGSFSNLTELMYLELDNNSLSGIIPSELGMCRKLALLNFAQNQFTGSLPRFLGNLTNLQGLNLQMNNFSGAIPSEITQLNRLLKLNLSRNSLSGSIPTSISSLKNLTSLDLQSNNLSGSIPDSIGNLSSLIDLLLGKNQLTGPFPESFFGLQISTLNLSYNLFTGKIPDSLSRLHKLEVLDLSNNKFSGEIPASLKGIGTLTQLILSNNELSGVVPDFGNFVDVNTEGNKDILTRRGNPNSGQLPKRKKRSLASDVAIAVASTAMAVGLFILIAVFFVRKYHRINDEHLHSEEETSPQQVVLGKFLTQNSIHRSNIDFEKAMEAVANNTNIRLKTRFSTYYNAMMPSGTAYFVKKLNWSDKIFQLGSHERFGEELEVLEKLCNSNVMIPLAYVLTIDSAYLFYEVAPKGTLSEVLHHRIGNTMDWASRYSIAIGVSQGLAFLHECSSGAILLLDLSSKSIFLKSLNEPLIGDIELCKVIDPSKSTGSLSTIAGSVGYVPPEYAYTMRVTAAGNVYSFGVILLELLTGKPAVSGGTELAKLVQSNNTRPNKWDQILDLSISKTSLAVRSQMLAVLKVALACVGIAPDARPKMKSVLRMLLNAR